MIDHDPLTDSVDVLADHGIHPRIIGRLEELWGRTMGDLIEDDGWRDLFYADVAEEIAESLACWRNENGIE